MSPVMRATHRGRTILVSSPSSEGYAVYHDERVVTPHVLHLIRILDSKIERIPTLTHQIFTHQNTVFTGKEPNRALGLSSLKPEDCVPEWEDLDETAQKTLNDWYTFFSKRYNVIGKVKRDAPKSGQL